jgi:hypothetical protein
MEIEQRALGKNGQYRWLLIRDQHAVADLPSSPAQVPPE